MRLPGALLGLLLLAATAHADGWLRLRGAYYKEKSTRVAQPMLDLGLDVGRHGTLDAHLAVDAITSASSSIPFEFSENRYEGSAGYAYDFGLVRLGAKLGLSSETDYQSRFGALRVERDFFGRNTTLGLTLAKRWDKISKNGDPAWGARNLEALLASVSATQTMSPVLVGSLTYDVMYHDGYQANAYRSVRPAGQGTYEETLPGERLRHAARAELRAFVRKTRSTVRLGYRLYIDDWSMRAHSPDVRLVQELAPGLDLRLRYRYHTQSPAFFYKEVYDSPEPYVTDDDKLGALSTHTVGTTFTFDLSLLGFAGIWGKMRADVLVERIWQDTSVGNAWLGEVGLYVPLVF